MKTTVLGLATFLLVSLFFVNATVSTSNLGAGEYDPQYDFDNDGDIDIFDIVDIVQRYGTSGTPLNDTDILELLSEINASLLELNERVADLEEIVYQEPIYPILGDCRYYSQAILLTLDVDSAPGFQAITDVSPGENVTINITFDIWEPSGPSILNQAFMIYSWTPVWPPPAGYYYPLYNGMPGYFGGTVRDSFNLTAPTSPGNHSLWLCAAEQYNMGDAVGTFTQLPSLPAHAQIIVETP